jgi:dolichol-phosphate mannosyltransferase
MNEEESIQPLIESIENAVGDFSYEIILVDDGSTDNTVPNIRKYGNEFTKTVVLNKNYGQTTAMGAGIDAAEGD